MRLRSRGAGLFAFGVCLGTGAVAALEAGSPQAAGSASAYYENCREVIQAGAPPMHRGQPGYRVELDADNDGVACEPYRRR